MCPQLPAIAHCGELAKLVPEPQVSLPWWQLDKLLPVSILASICDGCVSCLSHPQVEAHVCLSLCFWQGQPRVVAKASTMPASLA